MAYRLHKKETPQLRTEIEQSNQQTSLSERCEKNEGLNPQCRCVLRGQQPPPLSRHPSSWTEKSLNMACSGQYHHTHREAGKWW